MRDIVIALRHRSLRLLLAAGLISLTGDWILRVGLAYHVYVLTGSTLASAIMLLASFMPQIVLGSVAGVFVDRWHLKSTMVVTNLLLAAGLLPLLVVRHPSQIPIVYAVVAFEGCVAQFFGPAAQSVVPQIVDDEQLVTAKTLFQRNTTDAVRGRVFGSIGAIEGVAVVAGTLAAGFLGQSVGIVASISAQGIGPIIGGAVVLLTLHASAGPDQVSRLAERRSMAT